MPSKNKKNEERWYNKIIKKKLPADMDILKVKCLVIEEMMHSALTVARVNEIIDKEIMKNKKVAFDPLVSKRPKTRRKFDLSFNKCEAILRSSSRKRITRAMYPEENNRNRRTTFTEVFRLFKEKPRKSYSKGSSMMRDRCFLYRALRLCSLYWRYRFKCLKRGILCPLSIPGSSVAKFFFETSLLEYGITNLEWINRNNSSIVNVDHVNYLKEFFDDVKRRESEPRKNKKKKLTVFQKAPLMIPFGKQTSELWIKFDERVEKYFGEYETKEGMDNILREFLRHPEAVCRTVFLDLGFYYVGDGMYYG